VDARTSISACLARIYVEEEDPVEREPEVSECGLWFYAERAKRSVEPARSKNAANGTCNVARNNGIRICYRKLRVRALRGVRQNG
jgi:hypothetical protein